MIGVVSFPGSNGDHDALDALGLNVGAPVRLVDHRETDLGGLDAVVLPGGFSYGDYLRCGAIARFAPVMGEIQRFAASGGPVLGICNGFQILCEAGMLPGALRRNRTLRFHCFVATVRVEATDTAWTGLYPPHSVLSLPVAHGEGAYVAEAATLTRLEGEGRVVLRYCDETGNISLEHNHNGSVNGIAGVCNERRNVVGVMPHPERACDEVIGGRDGLPMLGSVLDVVGLRG
jgi:phosphoribosylformylglycinamidine synthase I